METLLNILNYLLPVIIIVVFIYFFLVLATCVIGEIRVKKHDSSMVWCMNKVGKVLYIVLFVGYVAYFCFSIWDFVMRLSEGINFIEAIDAFNLLTVYTVIYALMLQDSIFAGRKMILMGNRPYQYRRIKKVRFPKKHKMTFIYDQKELSTSTWLVDITLLKRYLVKSKD